MKEIKLVSLSAVFLLIFAAMLSSFPYGAVQEEQASQVSTPVGFGPYLVGWINTDAPKTGVETLPISIHYPAINPGVGTDPNATEAPYPTLLFSLGFGAKIGDYSFFVTTITSWGFVCVLVGSDSQAWDSERSNDLVETLNWLDEQNDNSSFKLSQMMDESKFGVLGHSLGGAATITASGNEPRFKLSVPIAPYILPGLTVATPESAADIHVPLLIVVGSSDQVSPPATMSSPVYGEGNSPKFYITITGVNHYSIVFNSRCLEYVVSFLKFYLHEDQEYARYFYGTPAQQEIDDGKIKLKYDLRKVTEYEVFSHGAKYTVLTYSDSTFLGLVYNQTLNQLEFTVTGPPDTLGTANITIPKQLTPKGYNITVYLDGESYPLAPTSNSTSYFVYLTYTHSQHQITIRFVDLTPPTLYIMSPSANSQVNSSNVTVGWIGSDNASGIDHYEVKLDENSWINVGTNVSHIFTEVADGAHTICVRAVDKAGNPTEIQASFNAKTAVSAPALIWMEWWFWAIICVAVMSMVILVFHIRRRRSTTMRANI